MAIERLPSAAFAPTDVVYEDVSGLLPLYENLAFRANLILVGPKGIGKSLSVAAHAAASGTPLITFDCSEDVRRSHLLGSFILRGDQTPFVLGPVTTAFEVANEVGEAILVFEEINALSPQCQKILNPLADFRRRIAVPEAQRVFELEPGAKLWVVGTMNTAVYGGVYELNEDLKSRFNLFPLEYPATSQEKRILEAVLQGRNLSKAAVDGVLRLAHETRQGQLNYALSTRDVVQILDNIEAIGLRDAMRIATGKFDDDDRVTIKERITSTFNVQV